MHFRFGAIWTDVDSLTRIPKISARIAIFFLEFFCQFPFHCLVGEGDENTRDIVVRLGQTEISLDVLGVRTRSEIKSQDQFHVGYLHLTILITIKCKV